MKLYVLTISLLFTLTSFCQKQHVRGVVYDGESGDGLPGVEVKIKGTDICSTTNDRGLYMVTVPDSKATIIYSAHNYNDFRVRAGNKIKINVVLNTDVVGSDDVDVGYGTQSSNQITGAVSTISSVKKTTPSYMISCVKLKKSK